MREQLARSGSLSMEKHVLPQAAVYDLMRRHSVDLLEVHEDRAVGHPDIISNTFFARKGTGRDRPLSASPVGPM